MKKCLSVILFSFLFVIFYSMPSTSENGNVALSKFQDRMRSIGGMRGTISLSFGDGNIVTGDFAYKAPDKIRVNLGNGKTIVANGRKLWVYDSASQVCGVQDLGGGSSGGIASMVSDYIAIAQPGMIKLTGGKYYSDITIAIDSTYMMKSVTFDSGGDSFTVSFSGVSVGGNLPSGMFDYSAPANSQVVLNPLNVR